LGQVEELLRHGMRRLELRPGYTERPQTQQHRETLWEISYLLTQRLGPGEAGF